MFTTSLRHVRFIAVVALVLTAIPMTGAAPQDAPLGPWNVFTPSPFNFWRFDAEDVPTLNRIFVLGGRLPDLTTDGSVWSFTVGFPGSWAFTGTTLDTPVSNYDIARLNDENGLGLYVFSGRSGTGTITTAVQVYYPQTNTATTIATDPWPGLAENGTVPFPGGVAVAANKAYAFGGFSATALSAETWIYDPSAPAGTRWTQGPDLGMARAYIASAVLVNRFIFAIGGDDWDGTSLIPQPIVERLDTQNLGAGWIPVADLPPASSGIAGCDENRAFGIGKYIVVAGCGQWNAVPSELADCFLYDALADTWTSYPSLNEARRNHAGALVRRGNRTAFYVLGGRQETDDNILNSSEFTLP
jgi:hypothetical protein